MKIVMLEPLGVKEEMIKNLSSKLIEMGHEFKVYNTVEKDTEALKERAKGADILIIANNPLNGEVIRSVENLKFISVAFTGVDHVDKNACMEKGIKVSNTAGYCTDSVAELTLGIILSLLRNIVPCNEVIRKEGTKDGLVGNELLGKTVGIVGTGAIGKRVAEIMKVFKCRILGYDKFPSDTAKDMGIEYVSLDELLSKSDIVTLHTPLTEETKGLINKEKIALMKPNAILINAARGPILDSEALSEALNNGRIAAAGIDVYEAEPPISSNHPLVNAKNTVLTPHVAFATKESIVRRAQITFDNIYAWLEGNQINKAL